MSYIDAFHDRQHDKILVVERDENGDRKYKDYHVKHHFYYESDEGNYRSIFNTPLRKAEADSSTELKSMAKNVDRKFESDTNKIYNVLSANYWQVPEPKLNIAFFDIEVDYDRERGYAPVTDPFNRITAITLHLSWTGQLITLCMRPTTVSHDEAKVTCSKFENTYLFEDEKDLLNTFLDLIDNADVISGWNSEFFDVPYVLNRIKRIMSENDTRRMCLWKALPQRKEVTEYGQKTEIYKLHGRVHLDFLEVYKKYTYIRKQSYALDAICEEELGEKKVNYEYSLDHLYNNDFEKFIEYSRQDVNLLVRLDDKHKFMNLVNSMAHDATVLLPDTLGTVKLVDQAIINEAHTRKLIVMDRSRDSVDTGGEYRLINTSRIIGGYVMPTRFGLHDWIGSVDIQSLYPSIIRALNMSPETIIGQFDGRHSDDFINNEIRKFKQNSNKDFNVTDFWEGRFASLEYELVMIQDDEYEFDLYTYRNNKEGETITGTGKYFYDLIFNQGNQWNLSANGTIFSTSTPGVISELVTRWFNDRIELKAKMKNEAPGEMRDYYDRSQAIAKIKINSLYGSLANPGSRFFDNRMAQSVTMTGRMIAKHMQSVVNEVLAGEYNHMGSALCAGDTDSAYFSAYPIYKDMIDSGQMPWDLDSIVTLYDHVVAKVNESFPQFMIDKFNCTPENAKIIVGNREIIGKRALFSAKKKYGILVVDDEGERVEKLKITGLEIKRSDTVKIVQNFLKELLEKVLHGGTETEAIQMIRDFRKVYNELPSWEKGSPTSVNNLTEYTAKFNKDSNTNLPGNVRPSINWNMMLDANNDNSTTRIINGSKIIVCKLKKNQWSMNSISYPVEESNLPDWFKQLPFDDDEMWHGVEKKINNIFGVLNWDLESASSTDLSSHSLFE